MTPMNFHPMYDWNQGQNRHPEWVVICPAICSSRLLYSISLFTAISSRLPDAYIENRAAKPRRNHVLFFVLLFLSCDAALENLPRLKIDMTYEQSRIHIGEIEGKTSTGSPPIQRCESTSLSQTQLVLPGGYEAGCMSNWLDAWVISD